MLRRQMGEVGRVLFWKDPQLKGKPGGERSQRDKVGAFDGDPMFGIQLLPQDVAEDAPLLPFVILTCPVQFVLETDRIDRQGDQLRSAVPEMPLAGRRPVILKEQDIFKPGILLQILDSGDGGLQNLGDLLGREGGH